MASDLADTLRSIRPSSLLAFWEDLHRRNLPSSPRPSGPRDAILHLQLEFLSSWADDRDVRAFFKAEPSCVSVLVKELHVGAKFLGFNAESFVRQLGSKLPQINFQETCCGCSPPYAGASHGWIDSRRLFQNGNEEGLQRQVHSTLCLVSFVTSLLSWRSDDVDIRRGQEALLDELLVPQTETMGLLTITYPSFLVIVGLVDNGSVILPKLAQKSLSLLSLVVARRPSKFLPLLDPEPVIASILKYCLHILNLFGGCCKVEVQFAVSEALSFLPLLYYLGDWKCSAAILGASELPATIVTMICNACHQASVVDQQAADLLVFPESENATVHDLFCLFAPSVHDLIRNKPYSVLCFGLIETLARWDTKGAVRLGSVRPYVMKDGDEDDRTDFRNAVAEYEQRCLALIDQDAEAFGFAREIVVKMSVLAPEASLDLRLPTQGLLRGSMLHCCLKCASKDCSSTTQLKHCTGGCNGLARYCSAACQRADWADHKGFCKR